MSVSAFLDLYEDLSIGPAKNFDPVRFAYLQSMFERIASAKADANQVLVAKARISAEQFREDLNRYRLQVEYIIDDVSQNFPEHLDEAQTLFGDCRFKQLEQLNFRLYQRQRNDQNLAGLRSLIEQINEPVEDEDAEPQQLSIDDVLYRQEQNTLVAAGEIPLDNTDGSGEQLVMQSMRQFRDSMKHFNIDKIIARAINEGPENPGPLNPQMLAIKSLVHMRDLSPPYLRRFANYIETLLWLEKSASKLSNFNKG